MRTFASVDEFALAKGETFGPTEWLTVDQGRVDRGVGVVTDHAAAAYDVLELHGAECA